MGLGRRGILLSLIASSVSPVLLRGKPQDAGQREPPPPGFPPFPPPDEEHHDRRLPNGKSQNDAIAKRDHELAMDEAKQLVELAGQLQHDLEQSGTFVVPLSSVKKTEQIEKLARRIRSHIKG